MWFIANSHYLEITLHAKSHQALEGIFQMWNWQFLQWVKIINKHKQMVIRIYLINTNINPLGNFAILYFVLFMAAIQHKIWHNIRYGCNNKFFVQFLHIWRQQNADFRRSVSICVDKLLLHAGCEQQHGLQELRFCLESLIHVHNQYAVLWPSLYSWWGYS